MNATPFDTLRLARKLEAAGFNSKQAGDTAEALADAMSDHVSTKTDLRETELRLAAEIKESKAELVKWMFGTIGFQTLVIIGALIALVRVVKP